MAKKESKELVKVEKAAGPLSPFEEMFKDFFTQPMSLLGPSWWPRIKWPEEVTPSVDIFEEGDDVVVKAELPGMNKEDVEVRLSEDTITISGDKRKEEKVQKKNYYRLERSYGSFTRSFALPAEVATDKARAQFKEGVLEIRIPKTEEAKKKEKRVTIE